MGALFDTDELRPLVTPARFESSARELELREALGAALDEIDRLQEHHRENARSYMRAIRDQYDKLEGADEAWHDAEKRRIKAEHERDEAKAITLRMLPVYEAAKYWRRIPDGNGQESWSALMALMGAIDAAVLEESAEREARQPEQRIRRHDKTIERLTHLLDLQSKDIWRMAEQIDERTRERDDARAHLEAMTGEAEQSIRQRNMALRGAEAVQTGIADFLCKLARELDEITQEHGAPIGYEHPRDALESAAAVIRAGRWEGDK